MRRATACALLLVLAACGVPTESTPRDIAADEMPVLLQPPQPSQEGDPSKDAPSIFLFDGQEDRLVETGRVLVPGRANVNAFVIALLATPTQSELDRGWNSEFDEDLMLEGTANLSPGVVLVKFRLADKDADPAVFSGTHGVRAIAQLVYTLTNLAGFEGVQVELNGEPLPLLDQDGQLITRAVTRADFRKYRPLPPPTTTTSTTSTTTTTRPTTTTRRRATTTSSTTVPVTASDSVPLDPNAPATTLPIG